MKTGIRWRVAGLGFAVALMGAMIAVVTFRCQRQVMLARERLNQLDSESFRIAERFKDELREVSDKMRRYATTEQPPAWDEFLQASQGLKDWIAVQRPRGSTEREKQILGQMEAAYGDYSRRAQELHAFMLADRKPGASLSEYEAFSQQARRLFDLSQELSRAHYEPRHELRAQVNRTLRQLDLWVLGLLALLFVFGVALAAVVYRELIAPLRVKLVQSQALAERNEKLASLGLLAAGVAHEVRNPLTAIKTALFTQQKKFPQGSPEHRDGEIIEREISRLERIVNEFLQFARPRQSQLAAVSAGESLREVQALLSPQLAAARIRLVREETPALWVAADEAQLKEVLINLVQNAAESIGREGTVTLRARPERRQLGGAERDVVVLEVADTGKGIPPEAQKRLFDPFFTTKATGTGLGLSIAARIVEMHGGALQYQTQMERGSTFAIVLPSSSGADGARMSRPPANRSPVGTVSALD